MGTIVKNWKTSLIGFFLLITTVYVFVMDGVLTPQMMVWLNIGVGFLFSKDGDVTGK